MNHHQDKDITVDHSSDNTLEGYSLSMPLTSRNSSTNVPVSVYFPSYQHQQADNDCEYQSSTSSFKRKSNTLWESKWCCPSMLLTVLGLSIAWS